LWRKQLPFHSFQLPGSVEGLTSNRDRSFHNGGYVSLSTSCKKLGPMADMIQELFADVGFEFNLDANLHVNIHEHNVSALTLAGLEPRRMTPCFKHNPIKYHWFQ